MTTASSRGPALNASRKARHSGFTLIELLLVIGIMGALASIVIYAINPAKQLAKARDTQRHSDVSAILNAVYQYAIDNNGRMPAVIPTGTALEICRAGAGSCSGGINLNTLLSGTYLLQIPADPQASAAGTGTSYFIVRDAATERITVSAPGGEERDDILVTR